MNYFIVRHHSAKLTIFFDPMLDHYLLKGSSMGGGAPLAGDGGRSGGGAPQFVTHAFVVFC